MKAIFKRELQAYFKTPVGYVFVGVFLFFSAIFFIAYTLLGGSPTLDSMFESISFILMFITPVLTMRLISEERNKKTDQILLTAPVSSESIVLGKFFAACVVFLISLAITLVYLMVIDFHVDVLYMQTICNYIGIILLGITLISIGLFISALTESQIVSAIISLAVFFALISGIDALNSLVSSPIFTAVFSALSVMTRFYDFYMGVLSLPNIIYFVSIICVFLTLTVHVLESRRFK